jgi:hypothetical protein
MLGHIDIDWASRRWSVAPPAINLVPGLGLCVVLTGSRPLHIDRRFDQATDDLEVYPFMMSQAPAPAAKFAKCASVEAAEHIAEGMAASFVVDPASALAGALCPVDEVPLGAASSPPPIDELQRFDPLTLRWVSDRGDDPGLYRFDLHGRPVHRRHDGNGGWWATDLSVGQFLALEGQRPVLRWRAPQADRPAWFEVRRELSLPILAERAATISSGLVPQISDGWRRYANVPRELAHQISKALLQNLQRR